MKWIGEEDNTSGSYIKTECQELKIRKGGRYDAKPLYLFESRFDVKYYISDEEAINSIENIFKQYEGEGIYEYLYNLVIEKFGAMDFVLLAEHKVARERDQGYIKGKEVMQKDIRSVLGVR